MLTVYTYSLYGKAWDDCLFLYGFLGRYLLLDKQPGIRAKIKFL